MTAAPALALNGVVADCEHHADKLTHQYSIAQLQKGFNSIPPEEREYSSCAQVIQNQIYTQSGEKHVKAGSGGGGSGSGFPLVPVVIAVVVVALGGGLAWRAYRSSRDGPDSPA